MQENLIHEKLPAPLERLKVRANPGADHPRLLDAFEELFRDNDKIPGGTSGAIIIERQTGGLLGGKSHEQKGKDRRRQLEKIKEKEEHKLSVRDKSNLENVLEDLDYALNFAFE